LTNDDVLGAGLPTPPVYRPKVSQVTRSDG
jgi:hypothetical protein